MWKRHTFFFGFFTFCRCALSLAGIALLTAFVSPSLFAQKKEPIDIIKVNTDLVVFDVQVVDRKTRNNIADLKDADFEIWDRGIKQKLTYFSYDELPLSIMLLLDVSDSVRPFIHRIRDGALRALQNLKPQDEVAVMAFASSSKLIQDFTLDRRLAATQIENATSAAKLGPLTQFAEAMDHAAVKMLNAPLGNRSVIIVVTDNFFVTSEFQEKIIVTDLFASGAVVYALLVNTSNPATGLKGGASAGIEHYVEQTGGETVKANNHDIADKLALLIEHLRLRYALGFRPTDTKDEKFRPVEIKLVRAGNAKDRRIVLTKRGYYFRRARFSRALPQKSCDDYLD